MFSARRSAALAVVLGTSLLALPAAADVVFTDNNFSDLSNYSGPTYTSDPGQASVTYGTNAGTLQFISTFNNNLQADSVAQGLVNSTFSYDPLAQGAIADINASVFKAISTTITSTGLGNHFYPTIEQGGVFYLATIAGSTFNGPGGISGTISATGLTAADFVSYNFATGTFGTANPNFDGGPMTFGLTQVTGTGGAGDAGTITTNYSDLVLDIVQAPEPASLALLGGSLIAFGVIRQRRKV